MRVIGNKLNRAILAPAFVTGTDYAALQIYSEQMKPVYVDGLAWGLRSTVPGDYALIAFNDLRILRIGRIENNNTTLTQILAMDAEEIYHSNTQGVRNAESEDFSEPLILESGNNYLVLVGDIVTTGATTGSVTVFLTVRGRIIPDKPVEKARLEQRDSAPAPDMAQEGKGNDSKRKC